LLRVDYRYGEGRFDYVTDWICVEHDGYAREKAVDGGDSGRPTPCP
jgi:hypothetical protein